MNNKRGDSDTRFVIKWGIVGLIVCLGIILYGSPPANAGERTLYVETSQQGESLDAFALRITSKALQVTRLGNKEVCGEFVLDNGVYTITMMTSNNQYECDVPRPVTNHRTGIIFHTHPSGSKADFYGGDYAMPGYLAHARGGVKFQNGVGTARRISIQ